MLQSLTIVLKPFNPLCLGRVRFQLYAKQLQTGRDAVDRVFYFVSKMAENSPKNASVQAVGCADGSSQFY